MNILFFLWRKIVSRVSKLKQTRFVLIYIRKKFQIFSIRIEHVWILFNFAYQLYMSL